MGLGEIFMRRLEEELFTSNPQLKACMSYWFRYMEDILCLWMGIAESLQAFLDVLKYGVRWESGNYSHESGHLDTLFSKQV